MQLDSSCCQFYAHPTICAIPVPTDTRIQVQLCEVCNPLTCLFCKINVKDILWTGAFSVHKSEMT